MTHSPPQRIDEVEKSYTPIATIGRITTVLFWVNAAVSLFMSYATSILGTTGQEALQVVFLALVLVYFTLSHFSRFSLVPQAERKRRLQMLSDAFGTPLSHDRTALFYNNQYPPSMRRLGANTMENAFFSKEVADKMLKRERLLIGGYIFVWFLAFGFRHNNLELLTWITQLVFSSEILTHWLKLEILRFRHERTFEQLHNHFLHQRGGKPSRAVADVIDAFVAYEAAKAAAGTMLSTKIFEQLNPTLTKKWEQIRRDLQMDKTTEQESP